MNFKAPFILEKIFKTQKEKIYAPLFCVDKSSEIKRKEINCFERKLYLNETMTNIKN